MGIDVHAHYVPKRILEKLEEKGADFGVSVATVEPHCQKCLEFAYGLKLRPFFPRLLEEEKTRIDRFVATGIERQILSVWADIFGYGMPADKGEKWHRLMNDSMADLCERHPERFSWMASGAMQDPARAAKELERAVKQAGAVGGVVGANVEGMNLGDINLDEYWAAAVELKVPVFIHPSQADQASAPSPRTKKYGLTQIAQYTYDTTLTVGSLIMGGVMDKYPGLEVILCHGGGTVPYLIGRFDCMHDRMDKKAFGDVAQHEPSHYLRRFHYDTILHNPKILRFLAEMVQVDRIVLGSDESFPPADHNPMKTVRDAGFSDSEIKTIATENPHRLFRLA